MTLMLRRRSPDTIRPSGEEANSGRLSELAAALSSDPARSWRQRLGGAVLEKLHVHGNPVNCMNIATYVRPNRPEGRVIAESLNHAGALQPLRLTIAEPALELGETRQTVHVMKRATLNQAGPPLTSLHIGAEDPRGLVVEFLRIEPGRGDVVTNRHLLWCLEGQMAEDDGSLSGLADILPLKQSQDRLRGVLFADVLEVVAVDPQLLDFRTIDIESTVSEWL